MRLSITCGVIFTSHEIGAIEAPTDINSLGVNCLSPFDPKAGTMKIVVTQGILCNVYIGRLGW